MWPFKQTISKEFWEFYTKEDQIKEDNQRIHCIDVYDEDQKENSNERSLSTCLENVRIRRRH